MYTTHWTLQPRAHAMVQLGLLTGQGRRVTCMTAPISVLHAQKHRATFHPELILLVTRLAAVMHGRRRDSDRLGDKHPIRLTALTPRPAAQRHVVRLEPGTAQSGIDTSQHIARARTHYPRLRTTLDSYRSKRCTVYGEDEAVSTQHRICVSKHR